MDGSKQPNAPVDIARPEPDRPKFRSWKRFFANPRINLTMTCDSDVQPQPIGCALADFPVGLFSAACHVIAALADNVFPRLEGRAVNPFRAHISRPPLYGQHQLWGTNPCGASRNDDCWAVRVAANT